MQGQSVDEGAEFGGFMCDPVPPTCGDHFSNLLNCRCLTHLLWCQACSVQELLFTSEGFLPGALALCLRSTSARRP